MIWGYFIRRFHEILPLLTLVYFPSFTGQMDNRSGLIFIAPSSRFDYPRVAHGGTFPSCGHNDVSFALVVSVAKAAASEVIVRQSLIFYVCPLLSHYYTRNLPYWIL